MIKRIIALAIFVPLGIALIMLSVANRTAVTLALNPFNPADTVLSVTLPFFVFLFVTLIIGMIIGSLATWFKQGKHRQRARANANEAVKWHSEADRQKAKAQQIAAALPAPDKRSAA
ncbi:LapA family protein [Hoeflea sp. YIM 152468]|uniref:LapA family protein n=1 Tax=Hoeflea sp. YIM 152468 TaxID=3031759 RepID=UPI0023DB259E|nr:LapA family protein [Hoeflea sp. YIM 152468]MDF1608316.1 LapA family protein [Hoeflea sp. YIM 152468]